MQCPQNRKSAELVDVEEAHNCSLAASSSACALGGGRGTAVAAAGSSDCALGCADSFVDAMAGTSVDAFASRSSGDEVAAVTAEAHLPLDNYSLPFAPHC